MKQLDLFGKHAMAGGSVGLGYAVGQRYLASRCSVN